MAMPRSDFGIEVLDGCVVAVGGIGPKRRPLKSVEKYNIKSDKWCKVPAMSVTRYGLGCTIVKNTKENILQ